MKKSSEQFPEDVEKYSQRHTKEDHCCDWEIKSKAFLFYPDVSGQSTYPVKFISKQIPGEARKEDQDSDEHKIFRDVAHVVVLRCSLLANP
jgi:hypothetical protein